MTADDEQTASVAVWYFLGATFVVALPMMLFPELPWWVRVATVAAALALILVGFVRLRREQSEQRGPTEQREPRGRPDPDDAPPRP